MPVRFVQLINKSLKLGLLTLPFLFFIVENIAPTLPSILARFKFFAKPNEAVHKNDEIFVLIEKDKIFDTLHDFGITVKPIENLVIFGGNAISYYIASILEKDDAIANCKIIEDDEDQSEECINDNSRYLRRKKNDRFSFW